MKNKELWKATKFILKENHFDISDDPSYVPLSSRFIGSIQAEVYQKIIKESAKGLLLDLGCGNVPLYEMYKNYIIDNICVDWGKSYNEDLHIDYEVDLNSDRLPFESETFETILLTDVLEHIMCPDKLMAEVSRLLKPNGNVILTVPFLYWLHEIPHDYYRYTEYGLRYFCEKNNLTVTTLEAYGGAPEVVLDMFAKNSAKSKIFSSLLFKFSKFFIKTKIGGHLSAKTSRYFPIGYCLVARK
jgi:SAM-dependent methyltransferase